MWNDKWSAEGLSLFGRANFDPGSLMAASIGATAIGAAQLSLPPNAPHTKRK